MKKELQGQVGGLPLEQWIVGSRNTAINGSSPIPPQIRQQLTGYADEDSMNRVRYKVGDNGVVNLARILEQGGFASAVTLIDVVVFRGPSEAQNPSIWAHELVHIDQYRDWGVHNFAISYARDYNSVEAPAYAKGNGYWQWASASGSGFAPQPQPQGVGNMCYTPMGNYGPGPIQPLGTPCSVMSPSGPIFGTVGPSVPFVR